MSRKEYIRKIIEEGADGGRGGFEGFGEPRIDLRGGGFGGGHAGGFGGGHQGGFGGGHGAGFGRRGGFRAPKGMIDKIILEILLGNPMHGYDIISTIEEKSNGLWKPSAGSVYPALTMLEEQDLLESAEDGKKKIYTLTSKGEAEAAKAAKRNAHFWERAAKMDSGHMKQRMQTMQAMQLMHEIHFNGNDEQQKQLGNAMDDFKNRLEAILYGELG